MLQTAQTDRRMDGCFELVDLGGSVECFVYDLKC